MSAQLLSMINVLNYSRTEVKNSAGYNAEGQLRFTLQIRVSTDTDNDRPDDTENEEEKRDAQKFAPHISHYLTPL